MKRTALLRLLNDTLASATFQDVAENGLQVEGKDDVFVVVCGVSANRALIEAAIEKRADAIVVHHGLVWGGGIRKLDGWLKERVRLLLAHNISLFAYHLPLDAHPALGNNKGLADALGLNDTAPFGRYKGQSIGLRGTLTPALSLSQLVARARAHVVDDGDAVYAFGDPQRAIASVGVCSGGAPDLLHEAIGAGLDAYVTGEVTEYVKAVADESGVCFLGLGHHKTERFGARALARFLVDHGVDAHFVDVENPA